MTTRSRSSRSDRPLADRAREAGEELEPDPPVVSALADRERAPAEGVDPEGLDAAVLAGVAAAGEMDRAAGAHVAPEYPAREPPSEIDVDTIVTAAGVPIGSAGAGDRLDGRASRPDDPVPLAEGTGERGLLDEADPDADDPYEAVLDGSLVDDEADLDDAPAPAARPSRPR